MFLLLEERDWRINLYLSIQKKNPLKEIMEILFLRVDYFFPWPTEAAFDISKEIQRL